MFTCCFLTFAKKLRMRTMEFQQCGNIVRVTFITVIAIGICSGLRKPVYSSNTGYDVSYGAVGGFPREMSWVAIANVLGEESETENCVPVNLYALIRHGTRYPNAEDIVSFQSLLSRLLGSSINPAYEYLRNEPQNRFTVDKAYQLVEEGFKELSDIASRIKTRFPYLYTKSSSLLLDSSFQSTDTNRTRDSAKGFISGFLKNCKFGEAQDGVINVSCFTDEGDQVTSKVLWHSGEGDVLLEPQENCQAHDDLLDKLDDESVHFRAGPEMLQVQANIEKLLTGKDEFPVSVDEIVALQKVCGMEDVLFNKSNWLDLFQPSDLRVMEYHRDLYEYWVSSYGHPINYQPSCVILRNITSYLRLGVEEPASTLTGVYKFAHSNTIQGLLTIMDLCRPSTIPRADNYPVDKDWDYATSVITPFASNVMFTLFRCAETYDSVRVHDEFRVLVTHNEQPVKVGPCESWFCPYLTLTQFLNSQAGSCNFDNICRNT